MYAEFTTDAAPDAEYVHGLGRKPARYDPSEGYRFFYVDHLGSTRRMERDESSATMRVDYFPYGEVLTQAGTDETPYTFTGKELDAATGLQYFGARYYDPRIGRWLVVDPLAGKYPAWSPYVYAFDNPTIIIDLTRSAPDSVDDLYYYDLYTEFQNDPNNLTPGQIEELMLYLGVGQLEATFSQLAKGAKQTPKLFVKGIAKAADLVSEGSTWVAIGGIVILITAPEAGVAVRASELVSWFRAK